MLIQNMVCNLSIKRIPDNVIIKEVYEQTSKTISKVALFYARKRVKRDFYQGYKKLLEADTNTFTNSRNELIKYMDES